MIKRKYEIMFILEALDYGKVKEDVLSIFKNNDCIVEKEEDIGVKTLAYPIKKQSKGFYYLTYVNASPSVLKEVNHDIRLNESILKYMCLVFDDKKIKSSTSRKPFTSNQPYEPRYKREAN